MKHIQTVTLADLEIRYKNIRKQNPNVKKCSVTGCNNPRDSTEGSGEDTCCAYHRLLFDFWSCEVVENPLALTQKGRRRAFTNWRNKQGKDGCDKIVLKLANGGINWVC